MTKSKIYVNTFLILSWDTSAPNQRWAIVQISLTTLVQEDQQVSCNTEVRDATVSSGRKYYLRINGKEV